MDGNLSDDGWRGATRIDRFFEIEPGDNLEPKVPSEALVTYDDKFFYVAIRCFDPHPRKIVAPVVDRDDISDSMDFAGVFLDTRDDRRTAFEFFVTAANVQYDAVKDDVSGNEDASPDFYWDSAARITHEGYVIEMRIPFSSLRYRNRDPQKWGITFFRNYPRDFRYQIASVPIPRGTNCLLCHESTLTGLARLPSGGHVVAAPYVSATQTATPVGDAGTPLAAPRLRGDGGMDVKWVPTADSAIDATFRPDFSQVESDVTKISANERFALFYPEKRPFFLEGSELFATPIQAVYTRTITTPRWGARMTGKAGATAYTALVTEDAGGGSVILPGSNGSDFASQDYRSLAAIARVRRDVGQSFVSVLATTREVAGGGHNRVFGPDFQWRARRDIFTGQLLFSDTRTPNRPDLTPQWTGQKMFSHAGTFSWQHSTRRWDWTAQYDDYGSGFRADNGFVPQVGYRKESIDFGYTLYPSGLLSKVRPGFTANRYTERDGSLITRDVSPGITISGRRNLSAQVRWAVDQVRAGNVVFPQQQVVYTVQVNPSRLLSRISIDGFAGQQVDFDNVRRGTGASINLVMRLRPTNSLEFEADQAVRWLNERVATTLPERLFVAQVSRLRTSYNFTPRIFVRLIGQYVHTTRDAALYVADVKAREGEFNGSALFAYKLNWQSVLFVGYGDDRTLVTDPTRLVRTGRQIFMKFSYALQR